MSLVWEGVAAVQLGAAMGPRAGVWNEIGGRIPCRVSGGGPPTEEEADFGCDFGGVSPASGAECEERGEGSLIPTASCGGGERGESIEIEISMGM